MRHAVTSKASVCASHARYAAIQAKQKVGIAIETFKRVGIIGTVQSAGSWMQQHTWETAMILAPLIMLAITAIALSAVSFGVAVIGAGT
jgi:hypothetical protein